jgi:RNA polymerase sigma factor (sigma-70 family)
MEADVEDLLQDVFTVVFCRGVFPPDDGQTRAYLWRIAHRTASNHRLLARHTRERSGEELPESSVEPRTLERIDAGRWILRAIHRLSPKLRHVIVALEIEGRTADDIAKELGIPVKTAHGRIRLARVEIARWRWLLD